MTLTTNDLKDYLDDLRKKGLNDEKKLEGMVDKANELATKDLGNNPDKGEYKSKVISIIQAFMHESVTERFINKLL
jgi:hypothetical protein